MSNEVIIEISARLDGVEKALKSLEKTSKDTGKKVEESLGGKVSASFSAIAAGVAAATAAVVSIYGAFKLASSAISEAAAQESAINKLNQSLRSAGTFSEAASKQIQDFAGDMQSVTTTADDVVLSMVAVARNFSKSNEEAVALTRAAMDLAAATGTDLNTAVEQLGGSLQGTAGRLTKLVPGMRDLTEEQLKAGAAIDLVASRFKGAAESELSTYEGSVKSLKNNFSELLETLGSAVVNNPALVNAFKAISTALVEINKIIVPMMPSLEAFITSFIKPASEWFTKAAISALGFADALNMMSVRSAKKDLEELNVALAKNQEALANLKSGGNVGIFGSDASVEIEKNIASLQAQIVKQQEVVENTQIGAASISTSLANIGVAFDNANFKIQNFTNENKKSNEDTRRDIAKTAESFSFSLDDIKAAFSGLRISSLKDIKTIGDAVKYLAGLVADSIFNGIVNAFSAMGQAMAEGGNGWEAFGKSVLRTLGQLAIQIGAFMVAVGLGMTPLAAIGIFGGPAAVAAGAALSLLGGALIGMSGGGGGASPVASAASSASTSIAGTTGFMNTGMSEIDVKNKFVESGAQARGVSFEDFVNALAESNAKSGDKFLEGIGLLRSDINDDMTALVEERAVKEEAKTNVNVNIAGSVLGDRRTLGREIAEALNEAFGSDGIVLASGAMV